MPETTARETVGLLPVAGERFRVNRLFQSWQALSAFAYRGVLADDPGHTAEQYAPIVSGHPDNLGVRSGDLLGRTVYLPPATYLRERLERVGPIRAAPRTELDPPDHPKDLGAPYEAVARLFAKVDELERLGRENRAVERAQKVEACADLLNAFADQQVSLGGRAFVAGIIPSGWYGSRARYATWRELIDNDDYRIELREDGPRGRRYTNQEIEDARDLLARFDHDSDRLAGEVVGLMTVTDAYAASPLWDQLRALMDAAGAVYVIDWLVHTVQLLGHTEVGRRYVRERIGPAFLASPELDAGRPFPGPFTEFHGFFADTLAWVKGDITPHARYATRGVGAVIKFGSEVWSQYLKAFLSAGNEAARAQCRYLLDGYDKLLKAVIGDTWLRKVGLELVLTTGDRARYSFFGREALARIMTDPGASDAERWMAGRVLRWKDELAALRQRAKQPPLEFDVVKRTPEAPATVSKLTQASHVYARIMVPVCAIFTLKAFYDFAKEPSVTRGAELLRAMANTVSACFQVQVAAARLRDAQLAAWGLQGAEAAKQGIKLAERGVAVIAVVVSLIDMTLSIMRRCAAATGDQAYRANVEVAAAAAGVVSACFTLCATVGWIPVWGWIAAFVFGLIGIVLTVFVMFWERWISNPTVGLMELRLEELREVIKQTPWFRGDRSGIKLQATLRFARHTDERGDEYMALVGNTLYPYEDIEALSRAFPSLGLREGGYYAYAKYLYGVVCAEVVRGDDLLTFDLRRAIDRREPGAEHGGPSGRGSALSIDFTRELARETTNAFGSRELVYQTRLINGQFEGRVPLLLPPGGEGAPTAPFACVGRMYAFFYHQTCLYEGKVRDDPLAVTSNALVYDPERQSTLGQVPGLVNPLHCTIKERQADPEERRRAWRAAAPEVELKDDRRIELRISRCPPSAYGKRIAIKLFDADTVSDQELSIVGGGCIRRWVGEDGTVVVDDLALHKYQGVGRWYQEECAEVYPVIYELALPDDVPQERDEVWRNRELAQPVSFARDGAIYRVGERRPWRMNLRWEEGRVVLSVCNIPAARRGAAVLVKFFDHDTSSSNDEVKRRNRNESHWVRTVDERDRFEVDDIASYRYYGWYEWEPEGTSELELMVQVQDADGKKLWDSWEDGSQWWRLAMRGEEITGVQEGS